MPIQLVRTNESSGEWANMRLSSLGVFISAVWLIWSGPRKKNESVLVLSGFIFTLAFFVNDPRGVNMKLYTLTGQDSFGDCHPASTRLTWGNQTL